MRRPYASSSVALLTALLVLGVATAPAALAEQKIRNPDIFKKSLDAARQALEYYGPYDDPEELRRINDIGYRIVQASGFEDYPFSFHLVDMIAPNAFALPCGQIFLTRGMLNLDLDDDMLAGLLGHEIAHVVMNHGLRMQRRATLFNVLSQALLVGVMVSAGGDGRSQDDLPHPYDVYGAGPNSSDRGNLLQGAYAAGVVVSELLLRSYSREFEDESDEEGQRWAAAAGFDPAGTEALMERMRTRLPQSGLYGYWQTHPFFEERVNAARVRKTALKIQEPESADELRQATQELLLDFGESKHEEALPLLKRAALAAWPRGERADAIRLELLHKRRDLALEPAELSRDYGALIADYRQVRDEVAELSPDSGLLMTLDDEIEGFETDRRALEARAVEVFENAVFETGFLEAFVSNFPESELLPAVSLALGDAYARLGRHADAVDRYLAAAVGSPDTPEGRRAHRGLESLVPRLEHLGALQQVAGLDNEPALRELAARRLIDRVNSYSDPANGAAYLERYPEGPFVQQVIDRQNVLADNLYGEVVLYQSVGENLKALERIQKILTYAPSSRAAERLRESAAIAS